MNPRIGYNQLGACPHRDMPQTSFVVFGERRLNRLGCYFGTLPWVFKVCQLIADAPGCSDGRIIVELLL